MKLLSSIIGISMALSSAPVLAVNANTADPCTQEKITDRLACKKLIRESQAVKNSTTREYIRLNTDILKQVKTNRRLSDLNNVSSTAAKLKSKAKILSNLEIQRAKTADRKQERLSAAQQRKEANTADAMTMLRRRIEAAKTKVQALTKTQVRAEIKATESAVQRRRNAINNARSICKDETGSAKLSCLRKQRDLLLGAQEAE